MELLPLGTLLDENRRETITMDETLVILSQGLHGLDYLHSQGYAHRDVSPNNILIHSRRPLHIKFSDFGTLKDTSVMLTVCGTAIYCAPELWATVDSKSRESRRKRLEKMYTAAVDIWAFGVIIYRLAFSGFGAENMRPEDYPESLIKAVSQMESSPLVDLLRDAMLVGKPDLRLPARECLKRVSEFPDHSYDRDLGNKAEAHPVDRILRRSSRLHKEHS